MTSWDEAVLLRENFIEQVIFDLSLVQRPGICYMKKKKMTWVVPHSVGPRFPGALLRRTRCPDTSPGIKDFPKPPQNRSL